MAEVLITGGTGMIGTRLSHLLSENGYQVSLLTRHPQKDAKFKEYKWSPDENYIDENAIINAGVIIHLAGANVAGKRWTEKRKQELYSSRVDTAQLIFDTCSQLGHFPKTFISASGSTIYGYDSGREVQREDQEMLGNDFLANLTKDWEKAAKRFADKNVRVVILRTSVVLTLDGGAFPKYLLPAKFGLAAPLGRGEQIISWIHIDDMIRMYLFALQNDVSGIYNATASGPVSNRYFMTILAKELSRPFFIPNVPSFALKLIYGELANVVLGGNNLSNEKILHEGFVFEYPDLNSALKNLLR